MIEINEEKFTLKAFGEEIELSYPTGDAVDELNESLSLVEHKGREIKIIREFFKRLGMKEEVLTRLQVPHFKQILDGLAPKKN